MGTPMMGSGQTIRLTGTVSTLTAKVLAMKETGGTTSKTAKDLRHGLKVHNTRATT